MLTYNGLVRVTHGLSHCNPKPVTVTYMYAPTSMSIFGAKRCEAIRPNSLPEEVLTHANSWRHRPGSTVTAMSEPCGLAIQHDDGQRKEEVIHTDEVLKRIEKQAEDVEHAQYGGGDERQGDQEAKDADATMVGRNVGADLPDHMPDKNQESQDVNLSARPHKASKSSNKLH